MTNGTEPKIRGAVVGAGHMGQYHILALAEIWGVELVGVVDTDFARAQQVAAPYGARAFRDHRDLAGLVDFATVAVPTEQHFAVARDLLEAGAHVLVEKPMTSTLEQAKELFRLARQQRRVLHVGHVERFNGAVQELRKIVERPILIESRRLGPFVPRVQDDSVVMDLMIHDIDIVLGLVDGEPRKITAVGSSVHSRRDRRGQRADRVRLGRDGHHHREPGHRGEDPHPRHHPARRLHPARLLAPGHPDPPARGPGVHPQPRVHPLPPGVLRGAPPRAQGQPLKLEIRHLISAVRAADSGGPVELPEADDLRSLAVALEIERMIREGRGETAWPEDLPWSVRSA